MESETLSSFLDVLNELAVWHDQLAQKIYAAEYVFCESKGDALKLYASYRQTLLQVAQGKLGFDTQNEQLAHIQKSISDLRGKLLRDQAE